MKKFNPNWIGLALIIGTFGYSAVRFTRISVGLAREEDPEGGNRVIRVLHWQLEPGYREGMELAIQAYNQLPHVRANNVEVRQLAVTERVYAQFINVHLISGTAPDIVARGMSSLVGSGASTARFFMPISEFVDQPNPYNAPEYLPEELDPELAHFLTNAPWNETFTDGMQGGWDDVLQDYYSVPVSSWGAMRTFYNIELVAEIKEFLANAFTQSEWPGWLSDVIRTEKMVTVDDAFTAWVHSPDSPDTLGRFMVFNEAVLAYAAATPGHGRLVPISASSYPAGTMVDRYILPFTYHIGDRIDFNRDSNVSGLEVAGAFQAGIWDFDEPALRDGFYDVVRWLSRYYPTGYLGLDREQAMRRFLNRQAVFITTGGWDASSLFTGAEGLFSVGVKEAPMPIEGERWFDHFAGAPSEAEHRLGVPLAIFNRTRNPDWALDFLHYLSSFTANQKMNVRAGWVPSVVGARPDPAMMPFLPRTEGLKGSLGMNKHWLPTVGHVFRGQFPLFQNGDIDYDTFVANLKDGFANERNGLNRMWFESFVGARDRARSNERSIALVQLEALRDGEMTDRLWTKHLNLLETNLRDLDGFSPPAVFHTLFEDRTFPEF
ncbi:MAG: extracellular solute-binding protein [Verrucomicrobia bacterium]|nr:extracellular solute-binding protein [Verrucomicrobiota bacterium]MCH8528098.1 hypothetical protein [Kiritimatiellia bacterium]